MPKRTIGTLIKTGFVNATREEMNDAYAAKFGAAPSANLPDEAVRNDLAKAYAPSPVPPGHDEPVVAPIHVGVAKAPQGLGKIPNLRVSGPWEGRCRKMIFRKNLQSKYSGEPSQSLGWNGHIWPVPLNVEVKVPWPYYQSAINTKLWDTGSDDVSEFVKTKDGRLEKHITPKAKETIDYSDLGDWPGTENLPIDYVDFFQRKAKETGMFKAFQRPVLIMIFNLLEVPRRNMNGTAPPEGMAFFRDMRDEDIRIAIAEFLGTPFVEMLQNELWEAATA